MRPTGAGSRRRANRIPSAARSRCPRTCSSCGPGRPPRSRASAGPCRAAGHRACSRSAARNGTSRGAGRNLPGRGRRARPARRRASRRRRRPCRPARWRGCCPSRTRRPACRGSFHTGLPRRPAARADRASARLRCRLVRRAAPPVRAARPCAGAARRFPLHEEGHGVPIALARQRPVGAVGDHGVQAGAAPGRIKGRGVDAGQRRFA